MNINDSPPENVVLNLLSRITPKWATHDVSQLREVLGELRQSCSPLGSFRVFQLHGAIVLNYGDRLYCLLRYRKDVRGGRAGRAIGCIDSVLPEDDAALRHEIDYAKKYGRVVPSAETRQGKWRR